MCDSNKSDGEVTDAVLKVKLKVKLPSLWYGTKLQRDILHQLPYPWHLQIPFVTGSFNSTSGSPLAPPVLAPPCLQPLKTTNSSTPAKLCKPSTGAAASLQINGKLQQHPRLQQAAGQISSAQLSSSLANCCQPASPGRARSFPCQGPRPRPLHQ